MLFVNQDVEILLYDSTVIVEIHHKQQKHSGTCAPPMLLDHSVLNNLIPFSQMQIKVYSVVQHQTFCVPLPAQMHLQPSAVILAAV